MNLTNNFVLLPQFYSVKQAPRGQNIALPRRIPKNPKKPLISLKFSDALPKTLYRPVRRAKDEDFGF